ncbi:hypothetical protein BMI86_10170 [Thioclava sp. DLFJ5-1]|uniref:hypothetical protein n=1 Tax=Thioclava sp. DLFJ5-1 TaxID=1915314 RepID=UPI000998A084|nr:hypothetical protein [Thioclava sp. DLFJ5-1]OOY20863.1 hypothetical protein BMI86_10170 [Thioclava sp. DLFJ5-1]
MSLTDDIEAFCARHNLKPSSVCQMAFKSPRFFERAKKREQDMAKKAKAFDAFTKSYEGAQEDEGAQ